MWVLILVGFPEPGPCKRSLRTTAGLLGRGVQNLPAVVPWWKVFPAHPALVPDMKVPTVEQRNHSLHPEGFPGTGHHAEDFMALVYNSIFFYFVLESNYN